MNTVRHILSLFFVLIFFFCSALLAAPTTDVSASNGRLYEHYRHHSEGDSNSNRVSHALARREDDVSSGRSNGNTDNDKEEEVAVVKLSSEHGPAHAPNPALEQQPRLKTTEQEKKEHHLSSSAPPLEQKQQQQQEAEQKQTKYFHEPGYDAESGHYDARYFKGKVPYEEHRPALRHLIRSYLTTFGDLGVETWLAHGSLLGWWWNGRIMPWDYDLDVQVSVATLALLGERLNGTLLDVNPHHADLTKGNGANIIDARWIDTSNGMFVDITGVREREAAKQPGVWSCKNNHRYRTAELWPLRRTTFEGVEARIPYAFDKVLTDEYGPKCLVTTEWAG
ncbi:LicD family-domain-containing protein [Xylariaceae sp. FL0594]|nr:LicD family-domain-containing protein [Xylariaceae sp. FL0594]